MTKFYEMAMTLYVREANQERFRSQEQLLDMVKTRIETFPEIGDYD